MAKKGKSQILVEFWTAKVVFAFLGFLPRSVAVAIGLAFGRFGFSVLAGMRRTALVNLELAYPTMALEERLKIAKGSFKNLGRVLGEMSKLRHATSEQVRDLVDLDEDGDIYTAFHKLKSDGRGIMVITGHLGNWELLAFAIAVAFEPFSYLARPIDNPRIEEMTWRFRTQFGNRPLNKTNSAMTAISILREGRALGIVADVNAHPKEGVFVPYFHVQACTPGGAATIARRSGAVLFPLFCVWDDKSRKYKLVRGRTIEPVKTDDRKADLVATTAAYTAEIEAIVRKYPDQWMWSHKRWKTRPKGEAEIYR